MRDAEETLEDAALLNVIYLTSSGFDVPRAHIRGIRRLNQTVLMSDL